MTVSLDFGHICQLAGGITFFLLGMQMATNGLRQAAGGRLRALLGLVTGNRLLGALVGALMTVSLQSSSATTVMLLGLVDSGMLTLRQTIAVILGANIGTTLTLQLIAFDLANYTLLLLAVGFAMRLLARPEPWYSFGEVLIGFGLVFYGMHLMKLGMRPLATSPGVAEWLREMGRRPELALLAAAVLTALLQSSGATLAIAIAMASQNVNPGGPFQPMLTPEAVVAVVLGAAIGTCGTVLLGGLAASRRGRRVIAAHIFLKLAAVALLLPFLKPLAEITTWSTRLIFELLRGAGDLSADFAARQVANAHTLFSIIVVLLFLPFARGLSRLIERAFPLPKGDAVAAVQNLDLKLLDSPEAALERAAQETHRAAGMVRKMLDSTLHGLEELEHAPLEFARRMDDRVDLLCAAVTEYLTRLSLRKLEPRVLRRKDMLLYIVRDVEYVGDLVSMNLCDHAQKLLRSGAAMSIEGARQLHDFGLEIGANCSAVLEAIATLNPAPGRRVLEYEERIETRRRQLHAAHLDRLRTGVREEIETSQVFMDMVIALRQINYFLADIVRALESGEPFAERTPESDFSDGGSR